MQCICKKQAWNFLVLLFAAALAGCSGTHSERDFTRIPTPLPPAFLVGPAAVFLTNTVGFSAQVETRTGNLVTEENGSRGQLLGSGSKLIFAPVHDKTEEKKSRGGNFLFIWDVAQGRGYLLSEALQGYAPLSSDLRATNVVGRTSANPGHVADFTTVQMNNGTAETFQVVWSADAKAVPLHINSISNAIPLTVSVSKARLEPVAADLFSPPDGFAKYDSPEALVDELAARQRNLRRKQPVSDLELLQSLQHQQGH
jgi:hypothetical protein